MDKKKIFKHKMIAFILTRDFIPKKFKSFIMRPYIDQEKVDDVNYLIKKNQETINKIINEEEIL